MQDYKCLGVPLQLETVDESDNFKVEIEVLAPVQDERRQQIARELQDIDEKLERTEKYIEKLNDEVERLTCHADGKDYLVAVVSGILAGMLDAIYVGEFSLDQANKWGSEKVEKFVIHVANNHGAKADNLESAVRYLEDHYKIAADTVTSQFGGGRQHHLRDFSHHPTPIGFIFSLVTQFTGKVYGTNTAGIFMSVDASEAGVLLIGKNVPEKWTFGVVNWVFHMVSDMAGSRDSIHAGSTGTGLPGFFVSFLKEISSIPLLHKLNSNGMKEFSVWISKLFNGTLLGSRDENGKLIPLKFDLRTEIGVVHELGRQALPVIINECIVRGFYFIRRLCTEIKNKNIQNVRELDRIEWEKTIPAKNRTIARMMTVASGVFTAMDMADAAIRAAVKTGGISPAMLPDMLLRINFVGVGRCAVAVATDIGMGIERNVYRDIRMRIYTWNNALLNAKVAYKQADMWISAQEAGQTIEEAYGLMKKTAVFWMESINEIEENLDKIEAYVPKIEENNLGLTEDMLDILKY